MIGFAIVLGLMLAACFGVGWAICTKVPPVRQALAHVVLLPIMVGTTTVIIHVLVDALQRISRDGEELLTGAALILAIVAYAFGALSGRKR